ncbi:MAG TPA: hypothetical protein VEH05_06430 [Streptosporangiaceae bacterium]|nr:hypothetical protein [Streptosporangiaceae bacterium]
MLSQRHHVGARDVLRSDATLTTSTPWGKRAAGARSASIGEYGQAKSAVIAKSWRQRG